MRRPEPHVPESPTDTIPSAPPSSIDLGASADPMAATDPVATSQARLFAPRHIQHYELIRELGRGGMGVVHLARDLRLGRLVAIKLLTRPEHAQERFLAEAQATARCRHENIVVLHEVGVHEEQPYLVFEYLRGQTLRQWMDARLGSAPEAHDASGSFASAPAPLAPARAVEMIVPVVRALVCAHDLGIIHRDLKPANILLTDEGVTKVLDFGVAKIGTGSTAGTMRDDARAQDGDASEASLSRTGLGARLGTLPYMSPEQIAGEHVDHRGDVWAVGVILFELVTGAHPLAPLSVHKLETLADRATPMPAVRERRSDLGPLAGIIDRCLLKDSEHRTATARALLQELEALLPAQRARARDEDRNPFAGLAAFQEADADRFSGRDHDVASLVGKLRSLPLVTVTGPSGAGKSSFVRAGVIPALKRSGEGWEAMVTRPGRQPLAALAEVLWTLPGQSSERHSARDAGHDTGHDAGHDPADASGGRDAIVARLRAEPGYLGIALRTWARARLRRLVLCVDQFEELYTLGADGDERACVLACLRAVADDATSPLRVILSVRSDFLDRMVENRAFLETVSRGLTFLPPLDRAGLREALVRPVEACDHRFESAAMVERILDELEATRSPLPLLQFTADKLWARRDRRQRLLSEASLDALGGVGGALASHADAILASMPAQDARLARAVFLRLITPERTRALVTLSELRQLGRDAESMGRVLTRLIDARLIAVEGSSASAPGGEGSDGVVEIVHESLIESWPLLGRWLAENEEDALFLARLRGAARDWQRGGQSPGLLWSGQAASEAHAWRHRYQGELVPAEERFLAAVFAAAERSRRLRHRLFGAALATAVVVALAMSYLTWRAEKEAEKARVQARLARDAERIVVAREVESDPTTVLALLREVEAPDVARFWQVQVSSAIRAGVARAALVGHTDQVFDVAFSPDGRRIATASWDGTVRLWRPDGIGAPPGAAPGAAPGASIVLAGHTDRVMDVAFSLDGARVVSASADRTARVWRSDGTGEALVLAGHTDGVRAAVFSPDGTRVLTASLDGTARVWSIGAPPGVPPGNPPGSPIILAGHTNQLGSACFSPDGTRVLTASHDGTARIWNADGTGSPIVLAGHTEPVFSATFSPDGTRVLTASADRTARVWNADDTGEPVVLRGHDAWVLDAVFDRSGRRVATASLDKTARVWNADGTGEPAGSPPDSQIVLAGHTDSVFTARFTPDGTRLVTASSDKTARIWSLDGTGTSIILGGHGGLVRAAVFAPDGARVVTASEDGTARVWDANGVPQPRLLGEHQSPVYSLAFSADGKRLVSGSADRTARVWTLDGSAAPVVLAGHAGPLSFAAFDPGGTRVVTGSLDKTVRVWSVDGTGEPLVLQGHTAWVSEGEFSPDGKSIVSAGADRTIRIWNADGTGEPVVLTGHSGEIMSVRFSADGRHVVSASIDKTVRVWHVAGGTAVRSLAHPAAVYYAAISPDGRRVVSAGGDGIARVWDLHGSEPPVLLQGHTGNLTSAAFSPDGTRVVTGSRDHTARIWNADGTGVPIVLRGHTTWVDYAVFSPDGKQVATASEDGTIRLWTDIAPIEIDHDSLWRVTSYCIPARLRRDLLSIDEETATAQHAACTRRVAEALAR